MLKIKFDASPKVLLKLDQSLYCAGGESNNNAKIYNPADFSRLAVYARDAADAAGRQHGAAPVELKATRDSDGRFTCSFSSRGAAI